jgi:hypothetical protein
MNILKLKEANEQHIIYYYQPDGEGSYGEVKINMDSKEAEVILLSDEDDTACFANRACLKLEKFLEDRKLPLSYTQAWW